MLLWLLFEKHQFCAASQRKKINPSVGSHPLLNGIPPWRKRSRLQSHPLHPSQWKCWRTNVATVAAHLWHSSTKDRCPTCLGLFHAWFGEDGNEAMMMTIKPINLIGISTLLGALWLMIKFYYIYIHSLALIMFGGFLSFHATEQGNYWKTLVIK